MKLSYTQTFETELQLPDPQQHAHEQIFTQLAQLLAKVFVCSREVLPAQELVRYSISLNILTDQELERVIKTAFEHGFQSAWPRTLH